MFIIRIHTYIHTYIVNGRRLPNDLGQDDEIAKTDCVPQTCCIATQKDENTQPLVFSSNTPNAAAVCHLMMPKLSLSQVGHWEVQKQKAVSALFQKLAKGRPRPNQPME